jgi:hypothetical protein
MKPVKKIVPSKLAKSLAKRPKPVKPYKTTPACVGIFPFDSLVVLFDQIKATAETLGGEAAAAVKSTVAIADDFATKLQKELDVFHKTIDDFAIKLGNSTSKAEALTEKLVGSLTDQMGKLQDEFEALINKLNPLPPTTVAQMRQPKCTKKCKH